MSEQIHFNKYAGYFHDGSLLAIEHHDQNVVLSMESSQIPPDEMTDNFKLSNFSTLKGKLHLDHVHYIKEGDSLIPKIQWKEYESCEIWDFDIEGNTVHLFVSWKNFGTGLNKKSEVASYTIEADGIRWENIPNLINTHCEPIENCLPLLRNGCVLTIKHRGDDYDGRIEICMEGPPLVQENRKGRFRLSNKHTLQGILLLDWVKAIKKDGVPVSTDQLMTVYDQGQILDFMIGMHKVLLTVKWTTLPPKAHQEKIECIEIEAGSIDWRKEPAS